jgi:hypothetical protein
MIIAEIEPVPGYFIASSIAVVHLQTSLRRITVDRFDMPNFKEHYSQLQKGALAVHGVVVRLCIGNMLMING